MASELHHLSDYEIHSVPSGRGKQFGIVVSEWNAEITLSLLSAAKATLLQHGVKEQDIHVKYVPGTFELVFGAKQHAQYHHLSAVICIGCVIKGETKHDEYISMSVAHGLQLLNAHQNIPFIFGVLTPNTMEQALDRAGGKYGNKGVEAAITALKMA